MGKSLSKELMKRIAIYKANNPHLTHAEIANDFNVKEHQVRYAIEKFAENVTLERNTKKGTAQQSAMIVEDIDDIEILRKQLKLCLSALECSENMPVGTRIELLLKSVRIRRIIQSLELERHMKRADAELIAQIIKRYEPDATDDDIIKIYNEELVKWRSNNGN